MATFVAFVMRTLAIGDVHGCLDELRELLDAVAYDPAADRLVFVGDLVDRGPSPAGVVRFVRKLAANGDVLAVQGNHEERMLRWFRRAADERAGGPRNKMTPPSPERLAEWEALSDGDRAWLASLPITLEAAPGWSAVHGGFDRARDPKTRERTMLRVRWVDGESGRMVTLQGNVHARPAGAVWWTERWRGPAHVVYGHAVHSLTHPRVDRSRAGVECWGIDTGCCFGGRLTALCLETREVFQVQARTAYADINSDKIE